MFPEELVRKLETAAVKIASYMPVSELAASLMFLSKYRHVASPLHEAADSLIQKNLPKAYTPFLESILLTVRQ